MMIKNFYQNKIDLLLLLRWKNHHGCALPAWQVKLYKKR